MGFLSKLGKIMDPLSLFAGGGPKNQLSQHIDPVGALIRSQRGTEPNLRGFLDPGSILKGNPYGGSGAGNAPPGVASAVLPPQLMRHPTSYPLPPMQGPLTQLAYQMMGLGPQAPMGHDMGLPPIPDGGPQIAMQPPLDVLRGSLGGRGMRAFRTLRR